ncbi:MAG TPA: hypothetical protein VGO32_05635 [Candidatus Limnocylindria bacterium]|jgi:hypothetical protein|nr:hypothetical protein [Candidatus Limnocylindria bacterium]
MTANRQPPPGVILGGVLIVIGLSVLAVRYLDVFAGESIWPLFIIGPGLLMIVLGLILPNVPMLVGGCVVATIGGILAWQNQTGLWATWAWIWALIPIASGVGSLLGGIRTGDREARNSGLWQIVIGVALLAVFFLFFEQFIGLSGGEIPVPEWAMPAVLMGLGVLILLRDFFERPDPDPTT